MTSTAPPLELVKERVGAELADVCGHLNVSHELMVALTAELLETGAWDADTGCHSPEQYLAWRTGLSPERAAQIVMIARRRRELPVTFAAFAAGLLSVDQVAVVARRVPAHNDAEACELARSATVAQLRVGLGKHFLTQPVPTADASTTSGSSGSTSSGSTSSGSTSSGSSSSESSSDPSTAASDPCASGSSGSDPSGSEVSGSDPSGSAGPSSAPADHPGPAATSGSNTERRLAVGFDDDGSFFLRGLTNGLDGAIIQRSLAEAKDALFADGDTDATWMDALVEVCRRSLAGVQSPSRRDLFSVVIHVDSEGAWIHNGPAIPAALLEQITCDGDVRPLWSSAGLPINLGRTHRVVPRRTRIVVEDRDGVCRHPMCTSSTHLQVHHVTHWTKGGVTDTCNLVCLCSRHHHAHHRGAFTISGNADDPSGLTFRDAPGNAIHSCGKPNPPGDRPPPEPSSPYAHPTGERLELRWLSFTPPPDHDPPESHRRN
jgi:hypothetical protein